MESTESKNPETMKTLMLIETLHGGMYFATAYLAAFLAAAVMILHSGFRKGFPIHTMLLIILSGVIFFILGNKMFTYTPEQWIQVFARLSFPETEKKTVLGGIIGLFVGIFIATKLLKFNRPALDTLAVALPVAMAISRIGCLFAGCCFGTETSLPWGIHYDAASPAYQVQLGLGLIHPHDLHSLAVHPAQAYQVIGCLIIAFIVWKSQKQWKAGGSLFLFSVLCYAVLRFFIEFVRAPESNLFAGSFFWGIRIIQWMGLAAILIMTAVLYYRERGTKAVVAAIQPSGHTDLRHFILCMIYAILVFSARKWFDILEFSTIMIFLVPCMIALSVKIYRNLTVAGYRWVIPVVLVCCFSFMAQKSNTKGNSNEVITFTSVGFTGLAGTYSEMVEEISKTWIPPSGGSCGSFGHPGYWSTSSALAGTGKNTYWQAGIDVNYNRWKGRYNKIQVGGRLSYGNESQSISTDYPSSSTFGISPYVNLDWRWIGFGGGFTLGQMKLPLGHNDISSYSAGDLISSEYKNFWFMPSLAFRAGPIDILYAEVHFPMLFPSFSPNPMVQTGIGSGLGKTNGTKVSAGYSYPGIYARAVIPIKNLLVLEGLYADNLSSGTNSKRVATLGINYRFSYKVSTAANLKTEKKDKTLRNFSKLRETVADIDGNIYHLVALGGQVWMAEDLKTRHFYDGTKIRGATESTDESGTRYDWSSVKDSLGICPRGWHVPKIDEWASMIKSLGDQGDVMYKLKKGFSPRAEVSQWWSSTDLNSGEAKSFYLNVVTDVIMFSDVVKSTGLSVRCMRDN